MGELRLAMQNDEIDLIDLIRVLFKRKIMISVVTVLITLIAIAACFILPANYEYRTMVKIGETIQDGKQQAVAVVIENPETVKAKLVDIFIPMIKAQLLNENSSAVLPEMTVTNPKNSNLMVLSTKGQKVLQPLVTRFHQGIGELLVADHAKQIKRALLPLDAKIVYAKIELEKLQDPLLRSLIEQRSNLAINGIERSIRNLKDTELILKNRLLSMVDKKKLLEQQLTELTAVIVQAQKNKTMAAAKIGSESQAMTLLMLNRQIEQDRTRQIGLRDQLLFKFDEQSNQLAQQIEDNIQQQTVQTNRIAELKNSYLKDISDNERAQQVQQQKVVEMQGLRDLTEHTTMISMAIPSLKPISPKKPLIVALGFMLGLMGSVMLAFLLEYLHQHKQDLD